jgi:hypothetical protein
MQYTHNNHERFIDEPTTLLVGKNEGKREVVLTITKKHDSSYTLGDIVLNMSEARGLLNLLSNTLNSIDGGN